MLNFINPPHARSGGSAPFSLPSFPKDSIVFAGQSNMVGQGTANPTYYNAIENFALDDVVKAYDDPYLVTTGTVYGTVFNNSSPGTGSAGYISDYLMSNNTRPIITVPAAKGGTGFAAGDWDTGGAHELGLIDRINKAKEFSNVRCVVWWQGEDDADEGTSAAAYEAYMDTLKANVAAGTGLNLKWIVIKLHAWNAGITGITEAEWNAIQDAQQNFADNNADVYLADLSDIQGNTSDRIHLDDDGYLAAASVIAKQILQNVYNQSNPDMLYAQDAAYYYNIPRDDITVAGTDITAITPSLDGGGVQNVGVTGRYPQDATGVNGLRVMDMDSQGFVRHGFTAGNEQTVFLAGTIPQHSGTGNWVFGIGSTASASAARSINLTSGNQLFIRDDAGSAQTIKDPIDDPQDFVMALRWNSTTSLEIWFNDTTAVLDIDPEDLSTLDYAWIGAGDSSGTTFNAVNGLQIAVAAQYERAFSDQEINRGLVYLAGLTGIDIVTFSPTDISGLQIWLDASDTDTITESSGSVSQWDDKSGNDNHATQGTGADQPTTGTETINGLNVIDFVDGHMETPAYTARTFFFVTNNANGSGRTEEVCSLVSSPDGSNNQYMFIRTNATDYSVSVDGAGTNSDNTATAYVDTGESGNDENIDLGLSIAEKAGERIWAFTADQDYADMSFIAHLDTGSAEYDAIIEIGEVIAYSGVLSTAQLNQVGNYLADKWGIAWTDVT